MSYYTLSNKGGALKRTGVEGGLRRPESEKGNKCQLLPSFQPDKQRGL